MADRHEGPPRADRDVAAKSRRGARHAPCGGTLRSRDMGRVDLLDKPGQRDAPSGCRPAGDNRAKQNGNRTRRHDPPNTLVDTEDSGPYLERK